MDFRHNTFKQNKSNHNAPKNNGYCNIFIKVPSIHQAFCRGQALYISTKDPITKDITTTLLTTADCTTTHFLIVIDLIKIDQQAIDML